ncbi:MAG: GNAT family N-acetyltransferase [Anaerolineales bacterium]
MMNTLETERLHIREFTTDDADFIFELLNDPSFIKNIGDRNIRSVEDAQRYILNGPVTSYAKNGFGLGLVILKSTGESIGMCGLIKRDALENVDIGYAFLPKYWHNGYAVESAMAMKNFAKDVVKLKHLVAIVDPANQDSIRVIEKIGLHFEKMIRLSEDDIELKLFSTHL